MEWPTASHGCSGIAEITDQRPTGSPGLQRGVGANKTARLSDRRAVMRRIVGAQLALL